MRSGSCLLVCEFLWAAVPKAPREPNNRPVSASQKWSIVGQFGPAKVNKGTGGKEGEAVKKKWENGTGRNGSQNDPYFSDFPPISCQFHTFFLYISQKFIFGNFS